MRRRSSLIEIRYLFARLRSLKRPAFWLPSAFLLLFILFTWESWRLPEGLGNFGAGLDEGGNGLSREDQAVGLDIDSSSLLMKDVGMTSQPAVSPALKERSTQKFLRDLALSTQRSVPSQKQASLAQADQTRFDLLVDPESATSEDQVSEKEQVPGTMWRSPLQTPSYAAMPLPTNQLELAFSRLAANVPTTLSQAAPIEGTTRLNNTPSNSGVPGISSSNAAPAVPVNSYTTLVEGTRSISPMSDLSGGMRVPTAVPSSAPLPSMMAQPPSGQSFGTVSNSPTMAQPEFAPVNQQVSQPFNQPVNPQPFTAPRSVPGRYIGGGNINTFSNP